MSPICCVVPEYILRAVVEKGEAPEHIISACQSTIDNTRRLQDARIQHGQSIVSAQQQQTAQAAGAVRHLKRTIYNAQNSWDSDDLPRDKVMIKEGGVLISKEEDSSQDANECYVGFKKTYDFYFEFFKRDSVNGRGLKLDGFVHYGQRYANAFWDGREMIFGDGDGHIFNGFTDELDVIAHELTHGVVQYTSPLEYKFQSGALNESIADVFGIMVKQWGTDPEHPQTVDQASWLIGEGIWAKNIKGKALRDMKNPGTAYDDATVGKDPQPAHWNDFKKLELSD
ncbi:zincin [Westerdykella ornata]|uniref:Zincin n=1 Tax=Westerdykella ornata TaxID=318751 RepID=A0A6A6JWC5_WESOR|nr:zincin [Westerdykella ornata]KAF2280036.1 zincin [Westerdykella ornata]